MNLCKRQLAAFTLLNSVLPTGGMAIDAKSIYPQRPVTLVVGYPPGEGIDTLARLLAEYLSRELRQKVLVENRPGAASNVAAESAARAKPDSYTLYLSTRSNTIHKAMYGHFDFDVVRDFMPVCLLARMPNVIVTGVHTSISTVADVVALARSHPGMVTYASTGVGSDTHLLGELFQRETHTKLQHVPYRGGTLAMGDIIGGRVDLLIFSLGGSLPFLKAGSVRAIALMSQQRAPIAENVPTMEESGVLGVDLETWVGLMAPAGTPPEFIARLSESVNKILLNPDLQKAFMAQGFVAPLQPNTPETFGQLLVEETDRWTTIVTERNIKLD